MADQRKQVNQNEEALKEVYGDLDELQRQVEQENKRLMSVLSGTFETDYGEQCLKWMSETFADQPSFDPANQYQTAFNEGCRHVVLTIKALLKQHKEGSS